MEGLATALTWLVSTAMSALATSFRVLAVVAIAGLAVVALFIGATRLYRPRPPSSSRRDTR